MAKSLNKKNELQRMVETYYKDKEYSDNLKALLDETNQKIKNRFDELGLTEITIRNLKATVTTSTRVTMDTDKLLRIILASEELEPLVKKNKLIKTKYYIDMDVLEDMIYHNDIPKNILKRISECKSEKEVKSLRITEMKKK